MKPTGLPPKQGLYDPDFEHDACGAGFVVNIKGAKSHEIVRQALTILRNLAHRGACGADANSGDGAGILLQVPHAFFVGEATKLGFALPEAGMYGVGTAFLPQDDADRQICENELQKITAEEGQQFLGWREVPTDSKTLGETAIAAQPVIRQFFVGRGDNVADALEFERKLFVIRKRTAHALRAAGIGGSEKFYVPSLSARTLVYKGMLTPEQVDEFYLDLHDPSMESALALVHSRFSTNTFPSWERSHPYRMIAHNGEINTIRGNVNWMRARQKQFASALFGEDLPKILPIINAEGSDSAMFDNCLEFLALSGRSLPHAMMMMIPEPWIGNEGMSADKKAFYQYHSCLMEPWDGPASIAFTDGTQIGAVLDRNGLRPSRYYVTKDDLVIMASEVGVLDIAPERIVSKGRLQPGRMFLVDTAEGRIISDDEIKESMAQEKPYGQWLDDNLIKIADLPVPTDVPTTTHETVVQRQLAFGYTFEDLRILMAPMARLGMEATGSMGNDTPMAVLSDKPQSLFNYFHQLFAQVTNPPIDCIREEIVTSSAMTIGTERNMLTPGPDNCNLIALESPILTNEDLAKLKQINRPGFETVTLPIVFRAADGPEGLVAAMEALFAGADRAIAEGKNILVLSDRNINPEMAPIPALLATAGLHHHLIRQGTRTRIGLVLESGEPREVHHFSLLVGYGVAAINPYLSLETIDDAIRENLLRDISPYDAKKNYGKAVVKGIVKVMSKMGISTIESYCGAQQFEAVGLHQSVIDRYFTRTASRIGGVGMDVIAREAGIRHAQAFPERGQHSRTLDVGGQYQWRSDGEYHLFSPQTIHKLQQAVRNNDKKAFTEYSELVNEQLEKKATLRGLLGLKFAPEPIPLEEVEPWTEIVKRFKTGAMSYGSISGEAHEALAIAMNRIGGKSNTGEGGEDPARFIPDANGDSRNSAIKQVASGRFGVTSNYLVNAQELQIKMAQGAKPGEGGQLPGSKVYPWIAKVRFSTPGVGLISPPPHHDIYSIEDLAELIHDLKNANTKARISVKLVAEVGVGTIAAGVAKAKADLVLISGYDGGTGASPQTSIKHAGLPWELGLAEAHQTLVLNDLRSRITVETDGQLKTGRDVVIAALLGAEEFGFATAPLVSLGCIMMRVCHLNTCPVGVATQDPELRKNFTGDPAHAVHFMQFVAEEVREIMAQLGFRKLTDMVGHTDRLEASAAIEHWKTRGLDFSNLFYQPNVGPEVGRYKQMAQDHGLSAALDNTQLLEICRPALENGEPVSATLPIHNVNRVTGTIVGSEVTRRYGAVGLPEDTISLTFDGSAGQSFGAFIPSGMTLRLNGDANDYLGKGLSGGKIIIAPPVGSSFVPSENIIIGNTALYGATSGEVYIQGGAGERFAVRNSGANAVVEAVGDHGCEYMTGGRVVVLGSTGRNFAAGMSGGIAYVLDDASDFASRCNKQMVGLEKLGDIAEIEEVRQLIRKHTEYTGSDHAARLLENWEETVPKFIKIIPHDFQRMQDAIARVEASGLTGDEALLAAFEENAKNMARAGGGFRHTRPLMGKPTGFIEYLRELPLDRTAAERIKDWKEFHFHLGEKKLREQGARCMDCGIPFCHTGTTLNGMASGCPVNNLIPEWNDLVYRGLWREALDRLHKTNNFPEFTGRVCPAPCEGACVLGINAPPVTIKNIECAIIDKGFEEGWVVAEPPERRTGKRVAVIGSGPAGLCAAAQLNKAGHLVTVFERGDRVGGLLTYGIPNMKLGKELVDRRVKLMEQEGIAFLTGTEVGKDYPADLLLKEFDAVVIATGATKPRGLSQIEGGDLHGIHYAMDFLTANTQNVLDGEPNKDFVNAQGKDVVVIGGGDTGTDCVGTSMRHGCRSLVQLEILPKPPKSRAPDNPWPQWPKVYRLDYGQEEALAVFGSDPRVYCTTAKKFVGDADGHVKEVHTVQIDWQHDDAGRFIPVEVPGTERVSPAQVVLLAMGFVGPEDTLLEQMGVARDVRSNVQAKYGDYATSVPSVFAAGDARRGQSLVVWAFNEGRGVARECDRYLMGETTLP